MNIFEELFLLQRIDNLIRTRATGTPKDLAQRLGISECSIYRLIGCLRAKGFPILYDKKEGSYYYYKPVHWQAEFVVDGEKLLSIKGGKNNFQNFSKLSCFDSEGTHFCDTF
jgi:biotin operon repressor